MLSTGKKKKRINIKDVEMEQKEECCNKYSYKIYAQLPIFFNECMMLIQLPVLKVRIKNNFQNC